MKRKRQVALDRCSSALLNLKKLYSGSKRIVCPHKAEGCDAFMLEKLIQYLKAVEIHPEYRDSFSRITVVTVHAKLLSFHSDPFPGHSAEQSRGADCGIQDKVIDIANVLWGMTLGIYFRDLE